MLKLSKISRQLLPALPYLLHPCSRPSGRNDKGLAFEMKVLQGILNLH